MSVSCIPLTKRTTVAMSMLESGGGRYSHHCGKETLTFGTTIPSLLNKRIERVFSVETLTVSLMSVEGRECVRRGILRTVCSISWYRVSSE